MAVLVYGVKFTCDCCGAEDAMADRYSAAAIRYDQLPVPEGWTALGLLGLTFTDVFATPVNHLCQVCGGLSIEQLTTRFKARAR